MKSLYLPFFSFLFPFLFVHEAKATVYTVNSQAAFDNAHDDAGANDSIIWEAGTYQDIYMLIDKNDLFIASEELGQTIFNGDSRVRINGDHITLEGFQYVGGDIGTSDVISIYGSDILIHQINIRAYTSYKYLRIRESSQYVVVKHCNFENRLNLDDQNILSILVDANQPGYHKIQYCSFKNFDGTGNDMGIEPIRIGLSTQADRISRSLVEYCYFTQCDGDGEIISSKATQNVYRYNTFENNPKAELVLRHGSEAIVYGNFFLNGKGGVRVREGQNHYIYNNYFSGIDDRTLYLQNEDSDPLDNIHIAYNTLVDCEEVRLGGSGSDKPTNVTFANNIFTDPQDDLFREPTGTETWIGNIVNGDLGMSLPSNGMTVVDPLLVLNGQGFWGLDPVSPAIDAAESGYLTLPQFPGMDSIDAEILFDLMGQNRPSAIEDRDLGCNEYPHDIEIKPIATEENTGPSYNTSTLSSIDSDKRIQKDFFQLYPNPVKDQLNMRLDLPYPGELMMEIYDLLGQRIRTFFPQTVSTGEYVVDQAIGDFASGTYKVKVTLKARSGADVRTQYRTFVKD
ncbi:MAG: chondroitinase-B domain-containing protein [Bacteroidota bacterium]